jgi:hypothetical protein
MVSFFKSKKTTFRSVFANNSVFNLHFMKVSSENDNNFGYEKNTIVVDNIPLSKETLSGNYREVNKNVKNIFLSMCDVKLFLTFTSLNLVLL